MLFPFKFIAITMFTPYSYLSDCLHFLCSLLCDRLFLWGGGEIFFPGSHSLLFNVAIVACIASYSCSLSGFTLMWRIKTVQADSLFSAIIACIPCIHPVTQTFWFFLRLISHGTCWTGSNLVRRPLLRGVQPGMTENCLFLLDFLFCSFIAFDSIVVWPQSSPSKLDMWTCGLHTMCATVVWQLMPGRPGNVLF